MLKRRTPVEFLESRQLLSATAEAPPVSAAAEGDELGTLVPTLFADVPDTALAGGKVKGASATVNITNVAPDEYNGPVTVTLFTSTDAALDAGDASVVEITKKLRIPSADSKPVVLKIKSFPDVPDGDYLLIAQVSSPTAGSGTNSTDETIRISAAFTDVSPTFGAIPTTPVAKGKRAKLTLNVSNAGNVDAKGTVPVTIALSTESGLVTLGTANAKLAVKPGASKTVKLNLTVPGDAPSGTFFLSASLAALPDETNTANNTVLSDATMTIA
jgi:hypothetical protein